MNSTSQQAQTKDNNSQSNDTHTIKHIHIFTSYTNHHFIKGLKISNKSKLNRDLSK